MDINSGDIAIVGGGLIGMMGAWYLNKCGYQVTIFDKSGIATESTWAGGGILSPLYPWRYANEINQLAAFSQKIYLELVEEIQQVSGISSEYIQSGLAIDKAEYEVAAQNWVKTATVQHEMTELDSDLLKPLNPLRDYVFFPRIAQVRNPKLAQSLSTALLKKGVKFVIDSEVTNLSTDTTRKINFQAGNNKYRVNKLVISAGAWSAKLLGQIGLTVDIRPIRGQMLLFKAVPGILKPILLAKGHYIIPRADGRILAGSTMEDVGFDKSTTQEAKQALLEFVYEYVPSLLDYEIEKQWSGLRPGSPSGIPLIGCHPEMENVFFNTGHYRNGVVLAPASAHLLTDIIQGKKSFVDADSFSYSKFVNRAAEFL